MSKLVDKINWFLEDPVVCRKVLNVSGWVGVGVVALMPEMAYAAFPIPGLTRLVTDAQDHITQEGSLIGGTLGIASGAARMAFGNMEMGIGNLVRAGAGGATAGSSPEVASYISTG